MSEPEEEDRPLAPQVHIEAEVTSAPEFFTTLCSRCGSAEFEWVIRDDRPFEVCERCGQVIETEKH